MDIVFMPLVAFGIYLGLVMILAEVGRRMAGTSPTSPLKQSLYASGEAPPRTQSVPGYQRFFGMALFFAILHLGVLILGSSAPTPMSIVYLVGLILGLLWLGNKL